MMYRVIFDFGDIEATVFHRSSSRNNEDIVEGAIQQVIYRNFGFPGEPSVNSVEPCPEWEEDETVTEWCCYCEEEVELPNEFKAHECPNCKTTILPCVQCENHKCSNCPLEN